MVLLVMGKSAENIGEKKKRDKRKTLKSGEEEKRRIRGKSNNSNIHFARKHYLKKKLFIPSNFIYSFYALQDT